MVNCMVQNANGADDWRVSRRRGSGRSVIDDIDFPMAILAYFFFLAVA